MSDGGNTNSLVSLGELSKPINTFIEKASEGVGGLFRPRQIKRIARAEAEAALLKAQTDLQISELEIQAAVRSSREQVVHHSNMASITQKAIPQIRDDVDSEDIDTDWYTHFYKNCRYVNDQQMQQLWANILAGQANDPGSFTKRTLDIVTSLEKREAEQFTKLCSFRWLLAGEPTCILYKKQELIHEAHGVFSSDLQDLEDCRLVEYDGLSNRYRSDIKIVPFEMEYFGRKLRVSQLPDDKYHDGRFAIGMCRLTKSGAELSKICNAKPSSEIYEKTLLNMAGFIKIQYEEV